MKIGTALGNLRFTAILEGISFLVLLGIAMPLKYIWEEPMAVQVVGMAHGILFIMYVLFLVQCTFLFKWNFKKFSLGFIASLLPFGPFVADRKLFKN